MALLFVLFGLSSALIGIAIFLMNLSNLMSFKDTVKNYYGCFIAIVLGIILLIIPALGSDPLRTETHYLLSNEFGGVHYSTVMRIKYDTKFYNWWTYKNISSDGDKNIVMEPYECPKQ